MLSAESIAQCVATVSKMAEQGLDMLVNNAGGGYAMPLVDVDTRQARELFDLNVWSVLEVTQAFLPLLLKAAPGSMIVNQSSLASVLPVPMTGIYNTSKAALSMLTDTLRLEMVPFGIKVVDLKTGNVKTPFYTNLNLRTQTRLPPDSIYGVAREQVEKALAGGNSDPMGIDAEIWARKVVAKLLAARPPVQVWNGANAWRSWFARTFLWFTFPDWTMLRLGELHIVSRNLAKKVQ